MSNENLLLAMQKQSAAVKRLLQTGTVGNSALLQGKTLAEVLALADVASKAYTDQEVLDLVEGNALIQAVDNAIAEAGMAVGGEFYTAITEKMIDLGATAAINVSEANHYKKTITGATTFSVNTVPVAGRVCSFVLHLTNGGSAVITWWANIRWAEGTAPTLTAAGRDVVAFSTNDGGATWDGYLLGKDMKAAA